MNTCACAREQSVNNNVMDVLLLTPNGTCHMITCIVITVIFIGWSYSTDSGFTQWSPWCGPNPTGAQCRCQQDDSQGTIDNYIRAILK